MDPALDTTGQAYSYAMDNPVNLADPSGQNPCDWNLFNGACRVVGTLAGDAGNAIHDAGGAVIGAWDHLTSDAVRYVRRALLTTLFDVNGLLVKVAQGGFAAGVNDGLIGFANGVAGLPGQVKDHLDKLGYYAQHPGDAVPLVKGLVVGYIKQQLADLPVNVLLGPGAAQALRGLWDVVQGLRHSAACGSLGHDLGYQLTKLVLQGAVAELGGKFIGALADAVRGEELFAARAEGDVVTERNLLGCDACFAAGTLVGMHGGSKSIDHLQVGDQVLAENTTTGKVEPERVEAVIDDGVKPLLAITLSDGSSISATPNHLFYVDGGPGIARPEWLAAADLQAGDRLRTEDGRDITITALRYHTGYAHVYTLTVAHDHTFFVGSAGVLVHNASIRCVFRGVGSRARAFNAARDYAGVPRSQQPLEQWTVTGDKRYKYPGPPTPNQSIVYSDNPTSWGNYYLYNTRSGRRIIADHTADPYQPAHFNVGIPTSSNPRGVYVNLGDMNSHFEYGGS